MEIFNTAVPVSWIQHPPKKFPLFIFRNLANAKSRGNLVCTSCDIVVLVVNGYYNNSWMICEEQKLLSACSTIICWRTIIQTCSSIIINWVFFLPNYQRNKKILTMSKLLIILWWDSINSTSSKFHKIIWYWKEDACVCNV